MNDEISRKRGQGFTLIEVVVVMAIIAVLASLVVGAINIARKAAKETQHRTDARTLQTALEAYFTQHKSYPDWGDYIDFVWASEQLNVKLSSSPDDFCSGYLSVYETPQNPVGDSGKPGNYAIQPINADCDQYLDIIVGP